MKVIPLQNLDDDTNVRRILSNPTESVLMSDEMVNLFVKFQRKDISPKTQTVLLTIVSSAAFYFRITSLMDEPSVLNGLLFAFSSLFVILLGWSTLALQAVFRFNITYEGSTMIKWCLEIMEKLWFFSLNISLLLEIVSIIYKSDHNDCDKHWYSVCHSESRHELPETLVAFIIFAPMLISVVIKTIRSRFVVAMWLNNLIFLVGFSAWKFHESALLIIALGSMSLIVLLEYHRQKLSMFRLSQQLMSVELDKEKLQIEVQANELKHLIGNVAHDLKTVRLFCEIFYFLTI